MDALATPQLLAYQPVYRPDDWDLVWSGALDAERLRADQTREQPVRFKQRLRWFADR